MHLTQGRGVHVEDDKYKKNLPMSYQTPEVGTENAVSCYLKS